MNKSVSKPSYTIYGPAQCWYGSCHYNLGLLRKLRQAVNTIMRHLQGYIEAQALRVQNASRLIDREIPEQEYEDYYFRLEMGETWYPNTDAELWQNVSAAMRPSLFQYRAKLNNAFLKSLYEIGPRFESDPIRLINTYHQKERNFRFFRSWGCAIFTLTIRKCEGTMKGYRPDGLCF